MKQQQTKKRLPIEITIHTAYNLPEESLTEVREVRLKAEKCAFMAEGLFRLIAKVCKDTAHADRALEPEIMTETLSLALGHCAEIGVALMSTCTDLIDKLEISSEKGKAAKAGN